LPAPEARIRLAPDPPRGGAVAQQTATSLEQQVHRVYALVDSMDMHAMAEMIADDGQGVDEISRGMRGRDALEQYFGQLENMVESVRSRVSDVHTTEWGDTGVVTCVVHQTYTMGGQEQDITAPTSITFRRQNGDEWKIVVFHSVPLEDMPEE
jgi:ketosteroid isomerase-like protein